ncbi:MAG: PD40 domain-containing protein [Acidobacteria bacterium]|nr:PD40 domain-containing protein [Acidobacteriota bacterium]
MKKTLVLIFSLLVVTVAAEAQDPSWKVAFNVLQDPKADDYEVYTIGIDGSGPRNVTGNKDVAWTYHSIPGKVLFVSDRGACRRCYFLYESDLEGGNIRKITNLQLEDSWMGSRSNGKELIVAGRIDTRVRYQLFIVDRESGAFRKLTQEPEAAFRDPTFSPDGKRVAYVYKKKRTDRTEIEEMYIMNLDGTNRRKLTTYPASDPLAKDPGYKVGPPQWNAKYDFISYQSNQEGKQSIYAVTPDGKKQWKLTDSKLDEGWHDWSPDGKWLVFDSRDAATGRYDLMLMNYRTKEIKNLTGSSAFKYHQAPVFIAPI